MLYISNKKIYESKRAFLITLVKSSKYVFLMFTMYIYTLQEYDKKTNYQILIQIVDK